MFVSEISAKTVRDRTPMAAAIGVSMAGAAIGFIAIGSAMKSTFADLSKSLPEAYSGMIGGAGSNYVVSATFGLLAPIAILVIAVTSGTRAFAREENMRTADLLLTQPVTRREVVVSKAVVMVGNIALASVGLGAGAALGSALIDLDGVTPSLMAAGAVHVFFLGLAFGMIALAVANTSGSAITGTGVTAGLALVANLVAGVLPMIDSLAWMAKLSPWYYFNGSAPIANGIDIAHLAVLLAIAAAAFAVAFVVVERRDVGSYRGGSPLELVLSKYPAIGTLTRPRVSSVFANSLSERQVVLGVTGASLFYFGIVMSIFYNSIDTALKDVAANLPRALDGFLGSTDISTPIGWMEGEMLATTAPIALIAVAAYLGVGALAGEADRHTLPLLVAGPVTRRSIVLDKALALVVGMVLIGVVTAIGLVVGSFLAGLGLGIINSFAALAHLTLLAIFFGTLALAIGAKWNTARSLQITAATAIVTYLANGLLAISDSTDPFAAASPWFYVSNAKALRDGANLGYLAVLAALSVICVVAATELFERREITT